VLGLVIGLVVGLAGAGALTKNSYNVL